MRDETGWTGRPKSKGRHAVDAVLFGGLALVFVWAGLNRLEGGEIELKRGNVIRLADDPTVFWLGMAMHVVIVVVCAWLAWLAVRGFLRLQRSERS